MAGFDPVYLQQNPVVKATHADLKHSVMDGLADQKMFAAKVSAAPSPLPANHGLAQVQALTLASENIQLKDDEECLQICRSG
jgi:hypothetical protein